MDNVNVEAAPSKKSSAGLVLGIIGFCLGLPQSICLLACTVLAGAAAGATGDEEAAGAGVLFLLAFILELVGSIMGFAACFSTKKAEKAKSAGTLMIVSGAMIIIAGLIGSGFIGIICGVLFLIGGIVSMKNANA